MKQILINSEGLETRIAVVENGKLQDYFIERRDQDHLVGSIFKGKIRNLEPSLQAAFVDIGAEKNAFLHYWDMLPATQEMLEDGEVAEPEPEPEPEPGPETAEAPPDAERKAPSLVSILRDKLLGRPAEPVAPSEPPPPPPRPNHRPRRRKGRSPFTVDDIPNLFKPGSEVLIQVTKGPIGTKGARVTTNLSLPGRYLVLLPNSSHAGVSRRIEDREERERLRAMLRGLSVPPNMGLICRTVGKGIDERFFGRDLEMLLSSWEQAEATNRDKPAPCCVYEEPGLVERALRDVLTGDVDEIVCDARDTHDAVEAIVSRLSRRERLKVRLYNNPMPVFHKYNLTEQIDVLSGRRVPLPGGGYIAIDETEALVAIDVNSGRNRTGKDHPETILTTNMEAVDEVARQLRLRNVGGLIVIDFIDMRARQDQQTVYRALKERLEEDRARTRVLPISTLGLVEMTRQREHESLRDTVYSPCPYCDGKGRVKSAVSVSVEIQRRVQELLRRRRGGLQLRITVHPDVLARLKNEDAVLLQAMERDLGGQLSFRADPGMHLEEFHVCDVNTGDEV